ncbi:hypothetical protein [Campylobacter hyointestinalis]|uniref:hypothetical protein n=1 Tax=Campylobacter hyointestinalis TaxID=198 RepID=UPI0015E20BAA|nr:hypothetical protein [Campylobacter hyointestinalis]
MPIICSNTTRFTKKSDVYNTAEGKAYAERLQNAITQTQLNQKVYEEALTKEQSSGK